MSPGFGPDESVGPGIPRWYLVGVTLRGLTMTSKNPDVGEVSKDADLSASGPLSLGQGAILTLEVCGGLNSKVPPGRGSL